MGELDPTMPAPSGEYDGDMEIMAMGDRVVWSIDMANGDYRSTQHMMLTAEEARDIADQLWVAAERVAPLKRRWRRDRDHHHP